MRGVHYPNPLPGNRRKGSSPHARGPRCHSPRRLRCSRIIPACAGSTTARAPGCPKPGDHPRMRGVHSVISALQTGSWGSSPHARGPLFLVLVFDYICRIIPACAGSTFGSWPFRWPAQDHPRMRGVHDSTSSVKLIREGSSPHARGPLRLFAQKINR